MLAIMNVGKYSTPSVPIGGDVIMRVLASTNVGYALKWFAQKGNKILAVAEHSPTVMYSINGGESWQQVQTPYALGYVFYSPTKDKFYLVEENADKGDTLHYAISDDGYTWEWKTVCTTVATSFVISHIITDDVDGVSITYLEYNSNTSKAKYIAFNTETEVSIELSQFDTTNSVNSKDRYKKTSSALAIPTSSASASGTNCITAGRFGIVAVSKTTYVSKLGYWDCSVYFDRFTKATASTNTPYVYDLCTSQNLIDGSEAYYTNVGSTKSDKFKDLGYFQIGRVFYIVSSEAIGKAGSVEEAHSLPLTERYPIGDMYNACAMHNVSDTLCLIATENGGIYLADIS